jgi:hypothetical protein
MNVYILKHDANRFQNLGCIGEDYIDWLQRFDGSSLASSWKPLTVEVIPEEDDPPASDFPALALHMPIFSKKATLALKETLDKHGELLPLLCKDGEYYAYNVTRVIDILNEDKSNLVRFPNGRILDIKDYSFNSAELGDCPIFKLPQTPLMDVFVTEAFKQKVEESGLTGFTFKFVGNVLPSN